MMEVETSGAASDASGQARPVVLLIMGLGMQLVAWPSTLIDALVDEGFHVVRFDNRDAGLSQHFDAAGTPNLLWEGLKYKLGWRTKPAYTLQDMAADALGVMDGLQISRAHVVGVSMGGMIAQWMAVLSPDRVASLASIMSSSGARGLPPPKPVATRAMLGRPANNSKAAAIEHTMKLLKTIGSPGFATDEAELRARVTLALERAYHPRGIMRQMVAVVSDTRRPAALARIAAPTLVVHGKADPLVPLACGQDTAKRIAGARLETIDGMGHDLAPGVVQRLMPPLIAHIHSASRSLASQQAAAV
ncbi:MAG: alpha/beta hydrolase fold protein [Polaromonas sp.]|nr:alpha/beta hydrolase fold protein [Polaromonas sp.]